VSHVEFHEHQDSVLDIYEPLAGNLAVFLCKLADRKYLPTDYYAAKDYNALQREMKQNP
jgi:hypothetical protein